MRPPVRADAAMRCSVSYDRDSLAGAAISACRIQSRHKRLCARGSGGEAVRFCRDDVPLVRARPCDSIVAFWLRFMSALALRRGFALGLRPALQFCCRVLASVYVRAGIMSRLCPRFASGLAILLPRFDFGLSPRWRYVAALPLVRVRPCDSVAAFWLRVMSALALRHGFALDSRPTYRFCRNVLSSVHACCLTPCAKQDGLRYLAFLFRRVEIAIRAFSRRWCGYLPWRVHFGFVRLFVAIPTGVPGTRGTRNGVRENGAGGAAFVRFYASTLALLCFPRGVRWG